VHTIDDVPGLAHQDPLALRLDQPEYTQIGHTSLKYTNSKAETIDF
jgi:hypothetical protein